MPQSRPTTTAKRHNSAPSKQGKLGFASKKSSSLQKQKSDTFIPPKGDILAAHVQPEPEPEPETQYESLDTKSKEIVSESRRILRSRNVPKIHANDLTDVDHILRDFDLNAQYGMTRLERWERANKMGLDPPLLVQKILITKQGRQLDDLKQGVFYKQV